MKKQLNLDKLVNQLEQLHLVKTSEMTRLEDLALALEQMKIQLNISTERQKTSEATIKKLNENLNQFQYESTYTEYKDIETTISSGDSIQLESYRSIPEFNGDKTMYRSWREQVTRRMNMIKAFQDHPKYEAALGIIRSKITKAASDILINNQTAYNIDAIIDRLDFSYADQRPLYVVEADMTSIRQSGKGLQEYYDKINQALNMVISKIVMTYRNTAEQQSLITEIQNKAVRTFILGMQSPMIRNILYGQGPKTLSQAYAIAQTVHYDNQHLQLDQNRDLQRMQDKIQSRILHQTSAPKFNPNFSYNKPQQPQRNFIKTEPMEVDISSRFKQTTNGQQLNQQMNTPQKREYVPSHQYAQQPQKIQRINQSGDNELNPHDDYEGDLCDDIPDDLISNTSPGSQTLENASTFLDE